MREERAWVRSTVAPFFFPLSILFLLFLFLFQWVDNRCTHQSRKHTRERWLGTMREACARCLSLFDPSIDLVSASPYSLSLSLSRSLSCFYTRLSVPSDSSEWTFHSAVKSECIKRITRKLDRADDRRESRFVRCTPILEIWQATSKRRVRSCPSFYRLSRVKVSGRVKVELRRGRKKEKRPREAVGWFCRAW